jgi:hypothetical protein
VVRLPACACAALLGCAVLAGEVQREARVTYFTGSTIYLDAGQDEGLEPGVLLTVMRGREVVATCSVGQLSTHKATCAVERSLLEPAVGDVATFVVDVAPAVVAEAAKPVRFGPGRRAGLRGRVGVRYLFVRDRANDHRDYSQPALDFRIDGSQLGGSPWGLDVDARARRTTRELADGGTEKQNRTRLYRAAVTRAGAGDPWSVTLGRQFSPALAAVSLFDGVSAEYGQARWALGLISGSQPDEVDYGYSSEIRDHGVYVRFHSDSQARRQYAISTGLIGSYQESQVNREFVYLQTRFYGPRLSLYATQELDYNRDWKTEAGEDSLSMTSTYANVDLRATSWLSLRAGFDSRRNVRLYRDFIDPEIEFDDSLREGVWGGVTTRFANRYSLGLDARTNRGESTGSSDAFTATFGASRLLRRYDVRARTTRYRNDAEQGWLHALTGGAYFGRRFHVQVGAGVRSERTLSGVAPEDDLVWFNAELDLALGRHWYWIASADRTVGDLSETDQYHSGVTYRF